MLPPSCFTVVIVFSWWEEWDLYWPWNLLPYTGEAYSKEFDIIYNNYILIHLLFPWVGWWLFISSLGPLPKAWEFEGSLLFSSVPRTELFWTEISCFSRFLLEPILQHRVTTPNALMTTDALAFHCQAHSSSSLSPWYLSSLILYCVESGTFPKSCMYLILVSWNYLKDLPCLTWLFYSFLCYKTLLQHSFKSQLNRFNRSVHFVMFFPIQTHPWKIYNMQDGGFPGPGQDYSFSQLLWCISEISFNICKLMRTISKTPWITH